MTTQTPGQQQPGPPGPADSEAGQPPAEPLGAGHPGRAGEAVAHGDPPGSGDTDPGPEGSSEVAELKDRWRRSLADLDNLRKRYGREVARERAAERDRVAEAFLPVLDNIDLALRHAESDPPAIVEGIRAIREQALAVLARLGYQRQEEAGVPFDPARHEVVALVPVGDAEGATAPGWVVDVVRPGYGDPDRQLRPASVTVARNPDS